MSDVLLAVVFVFSAAVSLATSWLLVTRLERIGARIGLSEALLGMLAALAADAPEITASISQNLQARLSYWRRSTNIAVRTRASVLGDKEGVQPAADETCFAVAAVLSSNIATAADRLRTRAR